MQYKEFYISELFDVVRGKSKYTRSYGRNNSGKYPVYSASLNSPLTYIDHYDHEGEFLSWTANGYAGRVQLLSGKFSVNGDRGLLIPTRKNLNLNYISKILQPKLRAQAIGRIIDGKKNEYTKLSPDKVKETLIVLPTDASGRINHKQQKLLIDRLMVIERRKADISSIRDTIKSMVLKIPQSSKSISIGLKDSNIFSLEIGNRILKKNLLEVGIPIYSANINIPFGFAKSSNLNDFSKPSLIWGIDGVFDWGYIPENTKFAITDHCGRLTIKSNKLDPKFVFYSLKSTKDQYGYDRTFRASLKNIQQAVLINIPLDSEGNFDLKEQKKIAKRYESLEQARFQIFNSLDELNSANVILSAQ